jgi:two-component system LytT family sensor kinase
MIVTLQARERLNSFLYALLGFEKTKKAGFAILVIALHILGWCLLFFLPLFFYPLRISNDRFFLFLFLDKTLLVGFFYLNYYLLIPRLFERRKYSTYFISIAVFFLFYFFQMVAIRATYFPGPVRAFVQEKNGSSIFAHNRQFFHQAGQMGEFAGERILSKDLPTIFGVPRNDIVMSTNNAISSFALILLIGGFIRLAYSFIRNQNEKRALENANLNAEVNFLKSQINPHFLFNTLNGIYSQAHKKSSTTESSILKLSELLRYALYDSGEDKVELAKDIQYLTNYIDLQRLRLSRKVKIDYEIAGDLKGKKIAPMLLITFVENAFKHGVSYSSPSVISISISLIEETLTMAVSNPVIETNSFAANGLGLKNAVRRLDLLYAENYWLDIQRDDEFYSVNLKINLKSD